MDSNNRKVIILAVVAVVVLVAVFIFTLNQLLNPSEPSGENVTAFPESGDRTDIPPPITDEFSEEYVPTTFPEEVVPEQPDFSAELAANESDWREPIIAYSEQPTAGTDGVTSIDTTSISVRSSSSVDDFIASGGLDYSKYESMYPASFDMGNGRVVTFEDLKNPASFAQAVNPYPSLVDDFANAKLCGTVKVPQTESGQAKFYNDLPKYIEVICLGEAVANKCSPAITEVIGPEGIPFWVYVGERTDGVCGVGTTVVPKYVSLCNLASVLNTNTDNSYTFNQWISSFKSEPGKTFAKIFTSESRSISGSDCVTTQVK
ncbi:hypothetical protein GW766_02700 [Candidatus Parcubacteria bacterium]|nr:hypothetical protein [Candidatus Parcubacteria bacterium]